MSNRKAVTVAVIFLLAVTITIALFFTMVTERQAIQWYGFTFLLFAELLAAAIFICVETIAHNHSGLMLRAGIYTVAVICFLAEATVSLAYISGIGSRLKWLVTTEVVIFALAAAISALILAFNKSVYESNKAQLKAATVLRQLAASVSVLKSDSKNSRYSSLLGKIYDSISYCDCSVYVPSDDLIAIKIDELKEALNQNSSANDGNISAIADAIAVLSTKRAAEVNILKAGSI